MANDPLALSGLSPRVRQELEDLVLDAIATYRAMLETGDTQTRIEVITKVLPYAQKLLAADAAGTDDESVAKDELRAMLAETWGPIAPKSKAS